jgi:hypothetical protein
MGVKRGHVEEEMQSEGVWEQGDEDDGRWVSNKSLDKIPQLELNNS